MREPIVYEGKLHRDSRGSIRFVNNFTFSNIKRFYEVEHTETIPRAFHGHLKEEKYVFVTRGSVLFCIVKLDNPQNPSKKNIVHKYYLDSKHPKILYIPPGYANGFKVIDKLSRVMFFSTFSVEESMNDDYRISHDYWGMGVWDE